jgi:hypothetical protein
LIFNSIYSKKQYIQIYNQNNYAILFGIFTFWLNSFESLHPNYNVSVLSQIPPVKLPPKSPQSIHIQNYSDKLLYPFLLNYYTIFPIFLVSKYCLISSKIKGSSIVDGMVNCSPSVNCRITFLRIFPERVLGKRFTKIVFR